MHLEEPPRLPCGEVQDDDRLITPDDSRFEGAEFISREARIQCRVANVEGLDGIQWRWTRWSEWSFQWRDPETGVESMEVCDHEHCVICHDEAFSEKYSGDLREGWKADFDGRAACWLYPNCFDRFRERFGWSVAT